MVFKISACYNTHLGASLTSSVIKSTSLSVLQFTTYASRGQSGSRKRLFGNRGPLQAKGGGILFPSVIAVQHRTKPAPIGA